jgi:type IV secretion system protein VirB1
MLDLAMLVTACAPQVAPSTIHKIIHVESRGNPLAINVNGHRLVRQPTSAQEAIGWTRWLIARNMSVDVGLMQVNSKNFAAVGLTPETAFDPCTNIAAGAALLTHKYQRAAATYGPGQQALGAALSMYNTGNADAGFSNGYVHRIVQAPAVAAGRE